MKPPISSTRAMANNRSRKRLYILSGILAGLVVGIWLALIFIVHLKQIQAVTGAVGSTVLILILWLVLKIFAEAGDRSARHWKKRAGDATRGAEGEELIASMLAKYETAGGTVLHDIRTPYGNIDHILITSRQNIFLIETKANRGTVLVENNRISIKGREPERDMIKQTLNNTYWLKSEVDRISGQDAWINSIIVFTNAFVPKPYQIKGIRITNKLFLEKTIDTLDATHSKSDLQAHLETIKNALRSQ